MQGGAKSLPAEACEASNNEQSELEQAVIGHSPIKFLQYADNQIYIYNYGSLLLLTLCVQYDIKSLIIKT